MITQEVALGAIVVDEIEIAASEGRGVVLSVEDCEHHTVFMKFVKEALDKAVEQVVFT
jgi:hypothetical protein